jgi:phosphatidylglycerophosphate synthase
MTVPDDTAYQPTERRPIKARGWAIWPRVVAGLIAAGLSANAISVLGMVAGVLAGGAFALTAMAGPYEWVAWLFAALFVQLRLLANLLDGMVAIAAGQASPVGELYNEVPDRVSDTAIFIGAGSAVGGDVVLGLLAACGALFTAYIRAMGKAAGAPQEYCGPMAKPQRMAIMTITAIFVAAAPATWHVPGGTMRLVLAVIAIGCVVTALRRLLRIARQLKGRPA